jgi:hypothetical protein
MGIFISLIIFILSLFVSVADLVIVIKAAKHKNLCFRDFNLLISRLALLFYVTAVLFDLSGK